MNRYIYFYVLIIGGWVLVQWQVPSTKIDRLWVESTLSKQIGGKATSHNLFQTLQKWELYALDMTFIINYL